MFTDSDGYNHIQLIYLEQVPQNVILIVVLLLYMSIYRIGVLCLI